MSPRKPILSPTRFAAYLECAVKYRYLYVDRIGRYYLRSSPDFSLGAALHKTLQEFHARGGREGVAALLERYERSWIPAGFADPGQEARYRSSGVEMIRNYHAAALESASHTIEPPETLFTEKTIRWDMGRFILGGRVDRIDRHADGSLEVVDYKSGRLEVTPEEVAADLAMSIYQLVLLRLYPGIRVKATIHCLRSGVTATSEMTAVEAEAFSSDITLLGEEIIDRDYENIEPERIEACEECEFLSRCSRFWRAQEQFEL